MKKILFLLCLSWINTGQAQLDSKIIFADYCENVPNFVSWSGTSKYVNWETWTYGDQDINNQSNPYGSLLRVAQGAYGAPAARKGTYSYRFFLRKRLDYPNANGGEQWVRNEMYWGAGCGENTGAEWFHASMYIPSTWCEDNRPVGVLFDFKFCNAQGPASFYLKIEDDKWQPTRQYPQGGTEFRYFLANAEFTDVEKSKWYDILIHRNFKQDGTGFMEMYMHKQGGTDGFTQVWNYSGANYVGTNESYLVQGLYKWSWKNAQGQGEGVGVCNDSMTVFYDNFIMARADATLSDWNDFISGGGAPSNQSPIVNAGVNQTITLPTSTAVMAATTSDPDGTVETLLWTKISGPTGGTISNSAIEDPTMSALQEGTYVFRLTGTDDDGASTSDDIQIVVQTAPSGTAPRWTNALSVTTAQRDTSIAESVTTLTYTSFSQANGTGYIAQMLFLAQLSGPNTATINYITQDGWQPTRLVVDLEDMIAGTYVFRLSTQDGDGNLAYDTINVNVIPASNDAPIVNAGADQTLVVDGYGPFQLRTTTLIGTATDGDGTVTSIQWQVLTGPENAVLGSPTNDTTVLSSLVKGTYTVRLFATDNDGAIAFNDVVIRVLGNDAGVDQAIVIPTTSITLVGTTNSVSDTTDVLWTKVSGTGGTIVSSGILTTSVTGLSVGNYVFELTITHTGGYIARDRINVTVAAATTTTDSYFKLQRGGSP